MQRRDRDVQVYRAAERSEYLPDRADKTAILTRIKENAKGVGIVASVAENAETVPVKKAEVELVGGYFAPQLMNAELSFPDIGVVKEHDGVGRQLRQPALIVMPHRLVGMPPVDVKKVDRSVLEPGQRVVKTRTDKLRERAVALIMKRREVAVDVLRIEPGVRIPLPGVDREARCR